MNTSRGSFRRALSIGLVCGCAATALALDATVKVSMPKNAGHVRLTVRDAGGLILGDQFIPIAYVPDLPGGLMSSIAKMAQIGPVVQGGMPQFAPQFVGDQLTLHNLPAGATVSFSGGTTGEERDAIVTAEDTRPITGTTFMLGHFAPMDTRGQPAIFTAGIVTDVGELTVNVSAQELNFQTDGPIICQALFQRLAPRAPQYGTQINYAGDRLEVYFDPAYTVTQGGIIFGTTSQSQGSSGELKMEQNQQGLLGDMNCDGIVSVADIGPFVLALTNPLAYAAAFPNCDPLNGDVNGDGELSVGDIGGFVALLTGG